MTRVQRMVLWTLAVCVFGYIAIHILIVKAPIPAQAKQSVTDPTEDTPLPEDDPGGFGAKRAAPTRVLNAICIDKGLPLEDVIVDVFRQTLDGSPLSPPRFETFGRTKTKEDGRFSVALPLIRGRTEEIQAAAMYVLYFTAPGRPIKSLIVADDTELPKEIFIPRELTEDIYLPTHYTIIAKSKGITASPMHSAIRGVSKDGKLFRVEGFVDERNEGKTRGAGYGASIGDPSGSSSQVGRPRSGQSTKQPRSATDPQADPNLGDPVVYALRNALPVEVAKVIESQFAGRFRQVGRDDRNAMIFVEADPETQAEIRGLIKYLDRDAKPFPNSGLSIVQREQVTAQERVRAARQKLADASTKDDKKAARAQLRKLLSDTFALDMQIRKKQAAEIESRLAKLRQQYQAREKVKDEIIDLQLKVIEQDAAGLGFPGGGSFAPTPASGAGTSRFGSGGGLRESPAPEEPLPGSYGASTNRVDKHDPIPRERTLEDVKKTHPTVIAALKDRGHFIESADGKLYAYANINFPSGPSIIRATDSATGKLLGNTVVHSVVGPLQFTDEGVASREGSELKLRIPLQRRKGPDGDVSAAAGLDPFVPAAAALDSEFLKKYSTDAQAHVGELSARGHFVGSPDGKLYAYVETEGDNIPEGTAEIRVCDARTGKRLAAAIVKTPVGKLKFAKEGVAIEFEDGTIISFSTEQGATVSILDRIESLGLKLGNETKTSLDTRHPMRLTGKAGEVTIKAGETKLIQLPKPTLVVQWQCGDFKPEGVEDVEPFDFVLVDWKSDGHVTWRCYRSPAASAPVDEKVGSGD